MCWKSCLLLSLLSTLSVPHSLLVMPIGTQGGNKASLQLSVSVQLLDRAPSVAQVPCLCLFSVSPSIFESVPLAPAIRCPIECRFRNRDSPPSDGMTCPSPSSLHEDRASALLFALYRQVLVEQGLISLFVIHRYSNPYKRVYWTQLW